MTDADDPRSFTKEQQAAFFATCQARFASALDDLFAAKVPIYCIMSSLIGFASESAAQAGMPRKDFLETVAEEYDDARKRLANRPS